MDLFAKRIQNEIKGEVDDGAEALEKYSHDASIFEVRPQVVVHPKDAADVSDLVRYVAKEKHGHPNLSITARSAGTCMSGGPLGQSIVADFTTHLNKIHEVGEGYAVVEPGCFYRDFEAATHTKGWELPCYTASKLINTVGGMVGNNSAGEKTLSYGQTKDFVEELSVVLSDGSSAVLKPLTEHELDHKMKLVTFEGKVYRDMYHLVKEHRAQINHAKPTTTKNSAGYYLWNVYQHGKFDLTQLVTGSQGTLALTTKIRFRTVKPKNERALLVTFVNDLSKLGDIVDFIMGFKPETLESFDDKTFGFALRYLPELLGQMKGSAIKIGIQFLPELWMTITGGVPKLILIAEFTDEDAVVAKHRAVDAQAHVEAKFGVKTHVAKSAAESEKYWAIRRESFSLLRKHVRGKHTAPFIDDIAVRSEYLPEFLPQLSAILGGYKELTYSIAGHAGDGNFHIIPLMDMKSPRSAQLIPEISDRVYDLVLHYHGTITAEHNDGIVRTPYLEKMYGPEIVALFEKTKKIFDPQNILNPGKKVGGSMEYLKSHIRRW